MEIYLISKPSIPDRTSYILGLSDRSPGAEMSEIGKQLRLSGADLLAVPCITAHYFRQEIERNAQIPMVDAIEETADYLRSRSVKKVGILATDGTIKSGLLQRAIEKQGMEVMIPDEDGQKKIMDIIYKDLKAGRPANMENFERVSECLRREGAEVILLACTELSLLKRDYRIGGGYLDVLEVLAAKVVESCTRLKPEYYELI